MAFGRTPTPFTPVILFTPETDSDRAAIKQVYSLYEDVRSTMNTERSQQQKIGISEIGNECTKCVARKLSGLYAKPQNLDEGWKAQVGTFGHSGLEHHFSEKYGSPDPWEKDEPGPPATDALPQYFMERRLQILKYKSLDLDGSCDMYIQGASFGIVDDWKFQGPSKLKKTSVGNIGQTYTVQMHTYGLGYELAGFHPTHVLLFALPRDGEIWEAKPVLMRYDRNVAIQALARLQTLIDAAEVIGWPETIAAQDKASGCWDCADYEKMEADDFLTNITS